MSRYLYSRLKLIDNKDYFRINKVRFYCTFSYLFSRNIRLCANILSDSKRDYVISEFWIH